MAIQANASFQPSTGVDVEALLVQQALQARSPSHSIGAAIQTAFGNVYSCSVRGDQGALHLFPYAMGEALLKGENVFSWVVIASQEGNKNDLCTCLDCFSHLRQYAEKARIRIVDDQGKIKWKLAVPRPVEPQPSPRLQISSVTTYPSSSRTTYSSSKYFWLQ